ncbi:nucleophosmin (nucleolar phosphoprotein B23, numatrin) L homeolog isoform X1 [Xenopus laevis]|uniref:Nucleophosmin n=1 Tax=Xenopus laevis TaxID=8355 RepID=A0A8J0UMZ3_XENLA|nr:nucleophosmin (nucleolar phosphoprotein B23, numatrin) L homeolog isoform X1 [Xenopus laevis]
MEDSMDMDTIAPLRPQNFLFGCELKGDKKEYSFKVEDDENEHQLSLRTVSLGASAKDELHVVEAEGINYEGKTIKIALASLKPSVQPTVSLGGFEITPPVILRLKSGSGPVYVSGQHLVALEDLESSDDEDDDEQIPSPKNAKRAAPNAASKVPLKKTRLEEEADSDEDDDDEDDDEDDEEEEETPVKKTDLSTKSKVAQKLNHNGKASELSATPKTPKTPEQKGKQDTKSQTPKTPKTPLSFEEMKAKMQTILEKGTVLPKVEVKFANYVKNCFRTDSQKVIQDLWKWRQSLKDGK